MLIGRFIPRHWVLMVAAAEHELECYEPSSGQVRPVTVDAMRRSRLTGLGYPRPFAFVVPRSAASPSSFAGIAAGLPTVILTTTGAKSGQPRTVALLGIPHPDGVAVVASNYGAAKHPSWYHNLKANPAATVTLEGETWDATAHLATPHEREEIWAKGIEIFPGLTKEQAWAGNRHIEGFILKRS
jgi:deazaflavin-dependent oxidoreductase (nitroreductase family)